MEEGALSPPASVDETALGEIEVYINVYDLLYPSGWLSSVLWTCGSPLLHTGVVINQQEYAFGYHGKRGISGIFWTQPGLEPPGGTFRCRLYQGVSRFSAADTQSIIRDISQAYLGPSWHLLTNNCNHFTAYLCERLTGGPVPSWLNRASTLGTFMPACFISRTWIEPPDAEDADAELLDETDYDERTPILSSEQLTLLRESDRRGSSERSTF